jgi:hypothetical protein
MKFITEEEIRDLYHAGPFPVYKSSPAERLTPGARQWLMDRGLIDLGDDPREAGVTHGMAKRSAPHGSSTGASPESSRGENGCGSDRLGLLVETLKADYYRTGLLLEKHEVSVAKKVMSLAGQLARARGGSDIKSELEFCECTGIKNGNFGDLLSDCFEITEYHAGRPRGEEIVALHLLRCKTRLLEQTVSEAEAPGMRCENKDALIEGLHEIINTLSRMICAAFGSNVCQKEQL